MQVNQQTMEIQFKIDDVKCAMRNLQVPLGINVSQAKKVISKITFIPMKELKVQKIFKNSQNQEDREVDAPKDDFVLSDKHFLLIEIAQFVENQLPFQFQFGPTRKMFQFIVYKNDTLYNIRTKMWIELKNDTKSVKFENPNQICMHFGEVKVDPDNDMHKEVKDFIKENKIQQHNQRYILDFDKDGGGNIDLMIHDCIFSTGMTKITFKSLISTVEDELELIKKFKERVSNVDGFKVMRDNYKNSSAEQNEGQVDENRFLEELYKNGDLHISLGTDENSQDMTKKGIKSDQPLPQGAIIRFILFNQ